jgi:glycosyl transferase family 25
MSIPAFLINLDRSQDRLRYMQAQADRIGLQVERFPAINGSAVPDHLRSQFAGSRLTPGQVGCYASHLCLHERVVRDDLSYALILEDDAELQDDLMLAAEKAMAAAPADWDYIQLSGTFKRPVLSIANLPNGRHLVRHWRLPGGTGAYLISRRGAEKMIAPGPRVRPVDLEIRYAWLRDLDVLGVYPAPVICNVQFNTTIIPEAGSKSTHSPGLISEVKGKVYRVRKLGLAGTALCVLATLRMRARRRRTGEIILITRSP